MGKIAKHQEIAKELEISFYICISYSIKKRYVNLLSKSIEFV